MKPASGVYDRSCPMLMLETVGQTAQRKYARAVLMKFFETCGVELGMLRQILYFKEKGGSEGCQLNIFGLASESLLSLGFKLIGPFAAITFTTIDRDEAKLLLMYNRAQWVSIRGLFY